LHDTPGRMQEKGVINVSTTVPLLLTCQRSVSAMHISLQAGSCQGQIKTSCADQTISIF
jgi:hypothetical protein